MKLETFKESKKKKTSIIVFTICCVLLITGVFLYESFALFQVNENFNLIEGNVGSLGDIHFTYYINGEIVKNPPEKNTGYQFDAESSNCTNGATLKWNHEIWGPNVGGLTSTQTKCNVHFKQAYEESLLNGTYPILKDELIPVTIDNDGVVKKADIKNKWYSYEENSWANAVILKDESITYENNKVIPEENIESYFVWIPRYKYQIFNDTLYTGVTAVENKPQRINVEFESVWKKESDGSTNGTWLTHPAFTSMESNGMWVGKFETSKSNSNPDNSINPDGIQIKPNEVSWRGIQVGNAFYSTYDYKRNLDSHMMKNTEWGAVAYLSHSKYGSESSVRFNNNSDFLTGYASVTEPTCGWTIDTQDCNRYGTSADITKPYNSEVGFLASTTGNISGIYDMSGGSWEYVMGVMTDANGIPLSGRNSSYNSEFLGPYGEGEGNLNGLKFPIEQYYDKYIASSNSDDYSRRILGDATGEMGPFEDISSRSISSWYADCSWFVNTINPWFVRGGDYTNGFVTGMFSFSNVYGSINEYFGFRVTLMP